MTAPPIPRLAHRPGRSFALVALAAALATAALFALGRDGWPGAPNGCIARDTCFCEAFRDGPVKQPANTVSNLGFVLVGLAIAAQRDADRRRPPAREVDNPITSSDLYATLLALVTTLLGPGSMALHASMTWWGGRTDVGSMYLWASFPLAYGLTRALRWSERRFVSAYLVLVGVLVASLFAPPGWSDAVFGVLVSGIGGVQLLVRRRRPDPRSNARWLAAAGVSFGLAFALWLPSRRSTGSLCDPDSWLQGHAAWHLLCAAAAGCIYLYLRSERPRALQQT